MLFTERLRHSLAEIDLVYFECINQLVGNKCRWWATYYPSSEKESIYDRLEMIVGDKARVNVLEMSQFQRQTKAENEYS